MQNKNKNFIIDDFGVLSTKIEEGVVLSIV